MMRPSVGVAVLIIKENTILLGKRIGSIGSGTWAAPGGHLEYNETFEDCARREVFEETGLTLGKVSFLTCTNNIYTDINKHDVTIYMKGEYTGGEPILKECDKCEGWLWVDVNDIPDPLFMSLQTLKNSGYLYTIFPS